MEAEQHCTILQFYIFSNLHLTILSISSLENSATTNSIKIVLKNLRKTPVSRQVITTVKRSVLVHLLHSVRFLYLFDVILKFLIKTRHIFFFTDAPHGTEMKVSIDNFFNFLQIWSQLPKKPSMENFIFCSAVYQNIVLSEIVRQCLTQISCQLFFILINEKIYIAPR